MSDDWIVLMRVSNEQNHCYSKHCVEPTGISKTRKRLPARKYRECVQWDAMFVHYFVNELVCCPRYRARFLRLFVGCVMNSLHVKLLPVQLEIIDYKWNYRLTYLIQEYIELEHALSWLSTLGGAFSALGDYFVLHAEMAGRISMHQFQLALRLGDPNIVARCHLYYSLSLIQKREYRRSARIIKHIHAWVRESPTRDRRLLKMCHGIWAKLQYEHSMVLELKRISF